ncbi:MAG: hypothetical protein HY482_01210 [Candidatus Wildermuthbacteria bacterium]|nr:hypothetical protein [Candidatus Wildermuthbacteria bacterium]
MPTYFSFPSKNESSIAEEREVLEKLSQAAKIASVLYESQKNAGHPGANFYPVGVTKKELEFAARKNPKILDPYTIVERKGKELVAVPYSVKYKKELEEISGLLKAAASMSSDRGLQAYLRSRAKDLLNDNYDKSNILWLKTKGSAVGCVIGAFDRYLDKLFFKKRAFMAWAGILDQKLTSEMNRLKELILTTERAFLPGANRARIANTEIRVEDTAAFSGLAADFLFVGNNLPSSADIDLIQKHGTVFTIFKPTLEWRFHAWVLPIFRRLFDEETKNKFSDQDLQSAFIQSVVLHESCHSLMRYKDAPARLEELFPYLDELFTDLLGIKGCGTLILKNALTEHELEAIVAVAVCRSLYFYASLLDRPHIDPYATGGALVMEFLCKAGALLQKKDGFHLDSYRALIALNQLTSIIEYYIALGNHAEAKEFLKRFAVKKIFSPFLPYLAGLPHGGSL